jgi:multimeric flavodoxin WrbA
MAKILLLNGSPHEHGCSYTALNEVASVLNKNGVETEIMWVGTKAINGCIDCGKCSETGRCIFNDLVNQIIDRLDEFDGIVVGSPVYYGGASAQVCCVLDRLCFCASPRLKGLYPDGNVAFFVSPWIYSIYEAYLDGNFGSAAYQDTMNGRKQLVYHGFPVIEVNVEPGITDSSLSKDFIIFTDRRNLVMAVNTADSPGSEVRMWYNPDEMENRQRAVFAIGCEILDEELLTAYINAQ